jgi:hypothetical protein
LKAHLPKVTNGFHTLAVTATTHSNESHAHGPLPRSEVQFTVALAVAHTLPHQVLLHSARGHVPLTMDAWLLPSLSRPISDGDGAADRGGMRGCGWGDVAVCEDVGEWARQQGLGMRMVLEERNDFVRAARELTPCVCVCVRVCAFEWMLVMTGREHRACVFVCTSVSV